MKRKLSRESAAPGMKRLLVLSLILLSVTAVLLARREAAAPSGDAGRPEATRAVDERAALVEAALYTRAEFFGAQALVPYPTAEARNRLADVLAKYPPEAQGLLKLSQLDEKLGREEEAAREMEAYAELEPDKRAGLEALAEFYGRRARFAQQAETLERLLSIAHGDERAPLLQRLLELAHAQRLEKYLSPSFYEQVIADDPAAFDVIEQYLDQLVHERNYPEALRILRQYKERFPERKVYLVKKETSILDAMGRAGEAEQVYRASFDPFWPDELSESFYEFLKEHDRFRAYGYELREAFRKESASFETAVRLLRYSEAAYQADPSVFVRLERARAARAQNWKPDELVTIARLLIADGYGDAASRFLYTLYLQGEMKRGSEMRAKVLYQLFELLSDAGDQRIALTRGDLKFYQDIAGADPHPGMLGGILSLLLSDTDPAAELRTEEEQAVEHFNRAAAYRIFAAYKEEYPTSPELAQMYLDMVRLYTATGDAEAARAMLSEFEKRYGDAPQYADVALKLADAYHTAEKYEEERAIYQRILDYLGRKRRRGVPLIPGPQQIISGPQSRSPGRQVLDIASEPTEVKPSPPDFTPFSNPGIRIPGEGDQQAGYSYSSESRYEDYLAPSAVAQAGTGEDGSGTYGRRRPRRADTAAGVDYATVLERYVSSLAKDNRTTDILALYAGEIKKYGDEQALYEQMLQWLGQTNLAEEQLRVYREALKQFPSTLWRDRMARWFLRRERKQEFASFSREILEKLNDEETVRYLSRFVDSDFNADAASFDANLYLGLYSMAHERFPHNLYFVQALLKFYGVHDQQEPWRNLMAEYYFESREIREQYLSDLAGKGELRERLERARSVCRAAAAQGEDAPLASTLLPYKLFRADAAVWLSNYEEAIDAYRELNRLYPNTPEFSVRLIAFTRSLGQRNRRFLEESASAAAELAHAFPAEADYRTSAGEIRAELGDYEKARAEWEQLVALKPGEPEAYLETATIYWDYFQYDDALRTILDLRRKMGDDRLYAFQAGAILEARHQTEAALAEYVRALDAGQADDREIAYNAMLDHNRARRRLATLYRRPGVPAQLDRAFAVERRRRSAKGSSLVLAYAGVLKDVKEWQRASVLLRDEAARSTSQGFLKDALDLFEEAEDADGSYLALNRLAAAAPTARLVISYRLRLASAYRAAGQTRPAAAILDELVQKFPTNYGVLNEAADSYWRLGQRESSLRTLRAGAERGRGKYHYIFARKLAAQEMELNRMGEAERLLKALHEEDPLNTEVFHDLAGIYVRNGNSDALKHIFHSTLDRIKAQPDVDMKKLREEVASLREQMIEAFTRLRDYDAAVEQYIEIVNRDPEDEEKLEAALGYARRYGGADRLLAYYQRTSQQAYKNYRWNVVLARIFETKGDLAGAARSYRAAIDNQPEMLELYDALASVYTRAKDYDAALEALGKATELSNEDAQYVRRRVELLLKAGRRQEAERERQKLPVEEPRRQTTRQQFAEAAALRLSEKSKAVEAYRQAWNAFAAEPYRHDLQASEITGYVQAVHDEEKLDQIMRNLWEMRERLVQDSERENETQAGKARELLQVFDRAMPEAVGGTASEKGTGEELSALFLELQKQVETAASAGAQDQHGTLSLLLDLSSRAGFGSLQERILKARIDSACASGNTALHHESLRQLVGFYSERGAYGRVIELLEAEKARDRAPGDFDYAGLMAENARLIGDAARELRALRDYYNQSNGATASQTDPTIERYFEALGASGDEGRNELLLCSEHPRAHHMQLVNFLLRAGERELAHRAIESAPMPLSWKEARSAEASLALGEFGPRDEGHFVNALRFEPIGGLIAQKPDASVQLIGDDWFRLAEEYGRWLYLAGEGEQRLKSRALLPAMIENRPHDEKEQARLARWYLDQHEPQRAVEHFTLALESAPGDKQSVAGLGSAYFLLGDKAKAEEQWASLVKDEKASAQDCELYLRTLCRHGRATDARARLFPLLVKKLRAIIASDYYGEGETNKDFDELKPLLRALSASFASKPEGAGEASRDGASSLYDEQARVAFFLKLCEAAPDDTLLPELLIEESLVGGDKLGPVYQLLVKRSRGLSSYDRDEEYAARLQTCWNAAEAEEILDQEQDYKISEPESKRLTWQRKYLEYLLVQRETERARPLLSSIENDLGRSYARPAWLRLAGLRLDVRAGQIDRAYAGLKHLVGIETGPGIKSVAPPDTVRLNDAVEMLREEGHDAHATRLLEESYARAIALGQYEPTYLAGLARIALARGDLSSGLKMLQAMVALGDEDERPETEASLASLPLIKAHAVEDAGIERPEASDRIERAAALRLAAETASEFAQLGAATGYRRELEGLAPEDEANRIELARLLSADAKIGEAAGELASIICDRRTSRRSRWQAVWLARELAAQSPELLASLRERVRSGNSSDTEMKAALEALSLYADGHADEAARLLLATEAGDPNPELKYFRALLERERGQTAAAAEGFTGALLAGENALALKAFDFAEDGPTTQLVRLYLSVGQPRAALKLAERLPSLRPDDENKKSGPAPQEDAASEQPSSAPQSPGAHKPPSYLQLDARAEERKALSRLDLLNLLSQAAEQVGDLNRAAELAKTREALLSKGPEREAASLRVQRLLDRQRGQSSAPSRKFIVDQESVARNQG